MPDDCSVEEPHAPLYVDQEARVAVRGERRALDRANARIRRCNGQGGFYDMLRGEWVQ